MSRLGGLVTLAWPQSGWARSGWVSPAVVLTASLAAGFFVGSSASGPYETYEESDLFAYVFEMPTTWDTGANTWDTGEQQ